MAVWECATCDPVVLAGRYASLTDWIQGPERTGEIRASQP